MNDVMHELRPLASYIDGNLRLLMRSGEHVLRIDEEAAHKLRVAFERDEPADSVLQGGFLQIDTNALDAMEWVADSRQPSKETRADRELRRLGGELFSGGWLRTLYDVAPANAAYSVAGLVAWKSAATLLVVDQDEAYAELDRREVLGALSRLWNNVTHPEDIQVRDFAGLYTDVLLGTTDEPGRRTKQRSADPKPTNEETDAGDRADEGQVAEEDSAEEPS